MATHVLLPPNEPPTPAGVRAGGWWHASDDGQRVVCDLCPRACALAEGAQGFCFVRKNVGGRMVSTTYGRSTGFCIDPVEKKPLNQFYPGTAILSFGTAGCNLGCKFCQNWEMSKSRQIDSLAERASPETVARAAKELNCRSVAFTYNDPVVWAEYAIDTAYACRELGVKAVAVTAGYITPAARKPFFDAMDAANVDLKGYTENFYWKLASGHLDPVLDTLRWLVHESRVWVEITNLMIPGENDDPRETEQMCRWILQELGPDVPLHFTGFHPDFRLTDRGPTPAETLHRARQIACEVGLRYVYTGNLRDRENQSTHCPHCRRVVIERDGYTLGAYHVRNGSCAHCGQPIAGHFDDRPGDWGARRQPVRIGTFDRPSGTTQEPRMPRPTDSQPATPTPAPMPPTAALSPAGAPPTGPAVQPPPFPFFAQPALTPEAERLTLRAASVPVASVACNQPSPPLREILGDAAGTPVYGSFVSLKRNGQLRSCCGFLGQSVPLAEALEHAALRAAKDDPRFPPIAPAELGLLALEVWILWGLQPVAARGEERVAAVEIGRHGLQIARGDRRGLLLPGVATEHKLNARQFLEQVCHKAGLPPDAWLLDDTQLFTFEGYAIEGPLDLAGLQPVSGPAGPTAQQLIDLGEFCRQNVYALLQGLTPSYYLNGGFEAAVCGAAINLQIPGTDGIFVSTFGLVAEKPLQSTLFTLTQAATQTLRQRPLTLPMLQALQVYVTVLLEAKPFGPLNQANLSTFDPKQHALLVSDRTRSAWGFNPERNVEQLLNEVVQNGQIADPLSAPAFAFRVASTAPRAYASYGVTGQPTADVRPPAVAGAFYPGDAAEIHRFLDAALPRDVQPAPYLAAMVPHAGWIYSGRLAAATLARVQVPQRVIVLCPKHRPGGAAWAVAPHAQWAFPGGALAGDPQLAAQLANSITGLTLDGVAHRQEHAIEVQLPILARLNPQTRVTGITIGGGSLEQLQQFGTQLAGVLASLPERPLLLISGDMNHYADEQETRRRDELALNTVLTLDPCRIYQTIQEQDISMCGMMPTVIVITALQKLGVLHRAEFVGYTTSAEASDDPSRVVGYAGMLFQ